MVEPLTNRELEELQMLAACMSKRGHRQPALPVTADTVKKRASHVLGKLSATNRTEAVAWADQLSRSGTTARGWRFHRVRTLG